MRRAAAAAALVVPLAVAGAGTAAAPIIAEEPGTVVAAFERRSYRPGNEAVLVVRTRLRRLTVQLLRAGRERTRPRRDDVLHGVPVTRPLLRFPRRAGRWAAIRFRIGAWPSGLYFARLSAGRGRFGYAPFVLRPRRLGESRVAVVLPTNTWQAYNFRDDNGDGVGDTWYANPAVASVDLSRPYLHRGVPPHFRHYDRAFVRWLAQTGKRADVLSDDDLGTIADGAHLSRLYDLVIFSGHEEYVTAHIFAMVTRYRDLGGNLAFLSANNFFYRVDRRGRRIYRIGRWRDLGRPAAPLVGVEYIGWFENRFRNAPYVVVGARRAPWLFRGTGLRNGDRFGTYGIEIDGTNARSPAGTVVLARVPNVFGRGRSAEMAYYTTRSGAKVFAAGSLNFGGSAENPVVRGLLENLWTHLRRP